MADDLFGILGTTQGAFTVERVVAEGGFGVVYRAYHGAFRAPVALKCLKIPPSMQTAQRAEFLEKFREEAEMLFRLSAAIPSVVRPLQHDVLTTASGLFVPFIALEWLDGQTLASLIAERRKARMPPLDLREAVQLFTPVARALEAAHRFPGPNGPICVVHRDLKPSNIFLANVHGVEMVKILDFGIARARDAASFTAGQVATTTDGLATAFTPTHGSPEQWAPKRFGATGPWTDVWGLAICFVETIAGRPLIVGDQIAMMGTVLDDCRRPTPRNEGIPVPDALEHVFRRALAVDPRARFRDAGAFWDEVELSLGLERSAPPIALPGRTGPRSNPEIGRGSAAAIRAPQLDFDAVPVSIGAPTVPIGAPPPTAPLALGPPARRPASRFPSEPLPGAMSPGIPLELESRPLRAPGRMAPLHDDPGHTNTVEFMGQFVLPLRLAGAGIVVSVLDQAAASLLFNGQRLGLGPFRLVWLAVALVVMGIAIAVVRLIGSNR